MTTGKTGAGGYKYFNEKAPEHDTFFCLHFNVFEKYFQRCYVTATWCGAAVLFVQPFPKHSLIYHYICLCVSGVILYVLRCSCTCTCILLIIGEFPVCVCVCVCVCVNTMLFPLLSQYVLQINTALRIRLVYNAGPCRQKWISRHCPLLNNSFPAKHHFFGSCPIKVSSRF